MPSYLHSALPCASFGLGLYRHSKRATAHQDCERGLVQTWKYFSRSPLKTAKVHERQAADVDSSKRKLVKACRTHWLSHGEAIKAMKAELSAVYTTLNYFASTKKRLHSSGYSSPNLYKALFVFPLLAAYCFRASKQVILTFLKRKLPFFSLAVSSCILQKRN